MQRRDRLNALQAVRAAAACLVVWDHAFSILRSAGLSHETSFPWFVGEFGVMIFFVISGFVMVLAHRRDFARSSAVGAFVMRRIGRVAPLYWLTTAIWSVKLARQGEIPSTTSLALSALFIPHAGRNGFGEPVYALGWTLQFEMFFYSAFAIALFLPVRVGLAGLCLTMLGLVTASRLAGLGGILGYLGQPVLLFFVAGILLGEMRTRLVDTSRLPRWLSFEKALAGALALIALTIALRYWGGLSLRPYAAVLIVAVAALSTETTTGVIQSTCSRLGDATYSIYLTHAFVIGPVGRVILRAMPSIETGPFVALLVLASLTSGLLVYRYVERPLLMGWRKLAERHFRQSAQKRIGS